MTAGWNGEIWTTLGRWKEVSFVLGFLPVPSKHTNSKQVSALSTGGLRYVVFLRAQTIKTTTRNHYAYFKEWSQTLLCELVYKIHVSTISGAAGGGGTLSVILVRVCEPIFLKTYPIFEKNDPFIYLIEQNIFIFIYCFYFFIFIYTICCLLTKFTNKYYNFGFWAGYLSKI